MNEVCIEARQSLTRICGRSTASRTFHHASEARTGHRLQRSAQQFNYQPKYQYRKFEKGLLRSDGEPLQHVTGQVELYFDAVRGLGRGSLPNYRSLPYSPSALRNFQ
jgi:hypothetical protein